MASSSTQNVSPAIGIDLGTTYSCVAVWQHDHVEIITNDQGNRTTPSWVAFTETERLVGEAAQNQAPSNAINTIYDVKRLIGRRFTEDSVQSDIQSWPFTVVPCLDSEKDNKPMIVATYKGEEKKYFPEEISSMVLMKMKDIAESKLGTEVKDAVITIPAYFNDAQRQATKDAGHIAGLNVMRIINEPTAAAIAYGLEKKAGEFTQKSKNILVFDLGGGTFDVSLVTISKEMFEVKAINGNTHLGGGDFDNRVVQHFVSEFKRKHNLDMSKNPRALVKLRAACEKAKRLLAGSVSAVIEIDHLFEGVDFFTNLSRARFEQLNMDLFKACIGCVDKCVSDAKMGKDDIHEIVLVGGSTRILKVQELLKSWFNGKELCKILDPDEAVAYGSAVQAAILSGVRQNRQFMLVDVTPLSLGVEVQGGGFHVMIPRNTKIPTKAEQAFYTTSDNATSVVTRIYEGESPIAKQNNFLGEFSLTGMKPGWFSKAKETDCFSIDANGILKVTSVDKRAKKMNEITITNYSGRLSKGEIDRLVEEAKRYRAEDLERSKMVEARAKLDIYVINTQATLQCEPRSDIGEEDMMKVENALKETAQWLDWNFNVTDASLFENKLAEIQAFCNVNYFNC